MVVRASGRSSRRGRRRCDRRRAPAATAECPGTVVARLDDLGALVRTVQALGARHAAYGVRGEAWAAAYGLLATTMQDAARGARLEQAA
jgi:hemoglobin-like flavoprotein